MIFLSYAKEDTRVVQEIYRELRYANLYPWMDKPPKPWTLDGIGPGEEWDAVIRQRLREADVILAFLSRTSIAKRGYVQREYRFALEIAVEQPAGLIFVVPVLLEDCEPPDLRVGSIGLLQFQWFKLHEGGVAQLITYLTEILTRIDTSEPRSSSRRLTKASASGQYKISLQRTIIDLFELDKLPPEKAAETLARLAQLIFQGVLIRVLPLLSEEQLAEYDRIIESEEGVDRLLFFFFETVDDFDEIVQEEAETFRAEAATVLSHLGM